MTAAAGGNTVAGLQTQLAGLLNNPALAGVVPGATGGGTAATGTPAAGAQATTAAAAPVPASATNQEVGTFGPLKTESGKSVMVTRAAGGKLSIPGTNMSERVQIGNKMVRFDGGGKEITAFQQVESFQFKVPIDNREGIATGLANLSRMFSARQERVKLLSNALADDANDSGSFNPADLQKMSLETTTTQQLSEMQKKIFDSMRDLIQAWLR